MTARPAHIPRRSPAQVMRLSRLGSLHQSRLSFMRILTRRMARENWQVTRPLFDIDDNGVGRAIYTIHTFARAYSLVCFAHDLPDDQRSDRVIAEAWDATFTLFDGNPDAADLTRLARNVPRQEAGRISETELTLARANRSVRLWDHVVGALAAGQQPEIEQIDAVGYLMRTTAVYGSGKFGAADRAVIAHRAEMQEPFQAEMLTVYLCRLFVRDLVEHMAQVAGGAAAVRLDPALARRLGIGNSTGLGMAPFIINHPVLFNNWIATREEAIAKVRDVATATPEDAQLFHDLLHRSRVSVARWHSDHPLQRAKLDRLHPDLEIVADWASRDDLLNDHPWDRLLRWCEGNVAEDAQELIASLMLEPYGSLVDCLTHGLSDSSPPTQIDGSQSIATTRALIEDCFGWALPLDWSDHATCARAWYVSAEKLEPRLGERFDEPIAAYEQPLAPARDAAAAYHDMGAWPDDSSIAEFLLRHPEHRHTIRRAQTPRNAPYAEIRDNTIAADLLPIDMLRAKLSFFGATHFDPRSDRWVRICMYQGAPYPEDLTPENADFWVYPALT